MKLSFKTILPIILISALLILLAGCFGVPADESPGYTPGTITGIIAAPCCSTSAEPVSETCCVSPEYWCYYCQANWLLQDGIEVVLTYGEDEVATVFTNKDGEFTFTNVDPGKNYVVTAYCPDFADNRPLVKDVALELIEGGSFDTNITDLVSISLGLVVDFLVLYTEWGPEDISLNDVLADRPSFPNFPKFKALIYEVRRVVENCEVNLLTDDDVLYATCRASEEISKLEIGCGPGATEGEGEDPCVGNTAPVIDEVTLNGTAISSPSTQDLVVGTSYTMVINASDDNILPKPANPLTYSLTITKGTDPSFDIDMGTTNTFTGTPLVGDVGTYAVYVNVNDGCTTTTWGPVTVVVDCCPFAEPGLTINFAQLMGIEMSKGRVLEPAEADITLCMDECATISSVTVHYAYNPPGFEEIFDLNDPRLDWTWDPEISFDPTVSGDVCLASGASPGTYTIQATYTDPCDNSVSTSVNIEFKDCTYTLTMAVSPPGSGMATDETGAGPYKEGTVVNIKAAANACYSFIGWTAPAGSFDNASLEETTFTMPGQDVTVTANFVSETNYAPVITSTPVLTADVGALYTYQIVATDADCWKTITYSLKDGPTGMTFNGVDTINWTPTCAQIGDHVVTVRATDNGTPALYDEQTFTITVLTNNLHAPTITPNPFGRHAVSSGKQYYYTVIGSDDDGDSVTYSLLPGETGVPKLMNIDSNGEITWDASCVYEIKCHICNWVKIIVRVTDTGCGNLYYEQPLVIEIWDGKVDGNNPKPDCNLMTDGNIIY